MSASDRINLQHSVIEDANVQRKELQPQQQWRQQRLAAGSAADPMQSKQETEDEVEQVCAANIHSEFITR